MNIVNLDFYNHHYFIRINNKEYYADRLEKFTQDIGYPFANNLGLLAYEPERNLYHIEYRDGSFQSDPLLQQFQWFAEELENLYDKIIQIEEDSAPVITLEMERAQLLYETDWIVQRHQEQLLRQVPTTLSDTEFRALLDYKQELRDLTQAHSKDEPAENISWPNKPFNF